MIPEPLADALAGPQHRLVAPDGVAQRGCAHLRFADAPPWIELDADDVATLTDLDEAIIETFVVDPTGLVALSDSPWLERWRPRAEAFAAAVLDAARAAGVVCVMPGHLTCSITPTRLLEGQRHFDDDQFRPNDGIGLVAVTGQHRAPGVARCLVATRHPPSPGPLPIDDEHMAAASWDPARPEHPDDIVLFGGFGQLHAGPSAIELGEQRPDFRQLMVLRIPTRPN